MNVLVVILNYNQNEFTQDLVNEFSNIKYPDEIKLHIVVGDINGNSNFFCTNLNTPFLYIKLSNLGYAKGNNLLIKKSEEYFDLNFDYYIISNPDIELGAYFNLEMLLESLKSNSKYFCVSPAVFTENGQIQGPYPELKGKDIIYRFWSPKKYKLSKDDYSREKLSTMSEVEVWRVIGAFMIINGADFRSINLFNEETFLYYEEDILALKARNQLSKSMLLFPQMKIIHKHKYSPITIKHRVFTIKSLYKYMKIRSNRRVFIIVVMIHSILYEIINHAYIKLTYKFKKRRDAI